MARKRGGTTGIFSGAQTAVGNQIGAVKSGSIDGLRRIYAVGLDLSAGMKFYALNTGTGAWTTLAAASATSGATLLTGRPFQHFNMLIVPQINFGTSGLAGLYALGGAGSTLANASGTAATITALSDTITGLTGISSQTQMEVGGFIYAQDSASPKNVYLGRIIDLTAAAGTVRVEPVPTTTFTANAVTFQTAWALASSAGTGSPRGGMVGCSWQNRILLGNVHDWNLGAPGTFPRRVIFTTLPNEVPSKDAPSLASQGFTQLMRNAFEAGNSFDIAGTDPITAMVPFGINRLLIFSSTRAHQVSGQLTTQTATQSAFTWSVDELAQSVGCLSDRSVQRTPYGVIFASQEGVYSTDGTSFRPLMDHKTANLWRDDLHAGAHIGGSAYMRGHYYVSTDGYGYLLNLTTLAWTRIFGPATKIFDSVPDPADVTLVWGLRWFTGSPPSMTNGQAVQLQSWFYPSSANRSDADGTAVTAQLVTRAYLDGSLTGNKTFTQSFASYDARNGTATVERSVADPSEAVWTSIGTLAATTTRSKRSLASVTQRGPSVAYRITTAACDSFILYALTDLFEPESQESSV